jgi:hypothetical protein
MSATKSSKKEQTWDDAIADAKNILDRVELRAIRLRGAIRTFREFRDSGEPYKQSSANEELATHN